MNCLCLGVFAQSLEILGFPPTSLYFSSKKKESEFHLFRSKQSLTFFICDLTNKPIHPLVFALQPGRSLPVKGLQEYGTHSANFNEKVHKLQSKFYGRIGANIL